MLLFFHVIFIIFLESSFSEEEFTISYEYPFSDDMPRRSILNDIVTIRCNAAYKPTNSQLILYNEDVRSAVESKYESSSGYFYVELNNTAIFGKLTCRLNERVTSNSISIPFVPCLDTDDTCQKSHCDPDGAEMKYCFYTPRGDRPCEYIQSLEWCRDEPDQYRYCPSGVRSLCAAIFKDYKKIWYKIWAHRSETCPPMNESPLSYKGVPLLYTQPFVMDASEKHLLLKCPLGSPFYDQAINASWHNDVSLEMSPSPCREGKRITVADNVFIGNTGAYTLHLHVFINGTLEGPEFLNRIIVFGTELVIDKKTDSDQYQNIYKCRLNSNIRQNNQVRAKTWWTKNSSGAQTIDEQWHTKKYHIKASIEANESDTYQCHALIEFKTCSPHRLFSRTIHSSPEYFQVKIKSSSTSKLTISSSGKTTSKSDTTSSGVTGDPAIRPRDGDSSGGNTLNCGRSALLLSIFVLTINQIIP